MIKKLTELLNIFIPDTLDITHIKNIENIEIHDLKIDSRLVNPGDLFLAYKGTVLDGKNFIQQAFDKGAVAVLSDEPVKNLENNKLVIYVPKLGEHISTIASVFYDNPSAKQDVYVFTGTNGKTTCSYLLAQLLFYLNLNLHLNRDLKKDVGLISTIGYGEINNILINNKFKPLKTTTPDPILLQKILYDYQSMGIDSVCMEGSSHALDQGRLSEVNVKTAVFTNLTHDHLDYHKNIEDYFLAKRKLFYFPGLQYAVINIDDAYGERLVFDLLNNNIINIDNHKPAVIICIYSSDKNKLEKFKKYDLSYVFCKEIIFGSDLVLSNKIKLEIYNQVSKQKDVFELNYNLLGMFNIYNLLAVIGCVVSNNFNNFSLTDLSACVSKLRPAPGRMESFYSKSKKVTLVVDYAHTPDALLQVLITLREYINNHNLKSKLWCIFGCGGDRDPSKRSVMGNIAVHNSDFVILTDDNPRNETPSRIIDDIILGIPEINKNKIFKIIHSRTDAIKQALLAANINDIILIAGKGHEDYQIYGNNIINYNEREYVAELANMANI